MNNYFNNEKEITTITDSFFKSTYYIVDYNIDPFNSLTLNRLIVIDKIPGKIFQFMGVKSERRYFIGRTSWEELIGDRRIRCPKNMEIELLKISIQLEKKYKNILKAKRLKNL